jgi:hypothetical protein
MEGFGIWVMCCSYKEPYAKAKDHIPILVEFQQEHQILLMRSLPHQYNDYNRDVDTV